MEQIVTLLDNTNTPLEPGVLPVELEVLYGGDLRFPKMDTRPYVIGNFVTTLDGVVSFEARGKSGGGDISGHNEADRFIMGLLRASADAVVVGAGTLREVAPEHLLLAEHVYPRGHERYARYRQGVLNKREPPLNVIVSSSGAVDLRRAVFRTPGVTAVIVTSPAGKEVLASNGVTALASTKVRSIEVFENKITPASILKLLRDEFGVKLLLHEGGPTLFGDFVAGGCLDELFLTVAPQFAGRSGSRLRPGVISGVAFLPETAPWLRLVSVKQCANHLYLRYGNPPNRSDRRAAQRPGNVSAEAGSFD
jgi:riboflavin biosynthesis pyrimidine reductase